MRNVDGCAGVNLRHLRMLHLVIACGTMRGAANMAGLSQPTISQGIRKLEEQFGTLLLSRERGSARATPAGAAVEVRIARVLRLISHVQRRVERSRRGGRCPTLEVMVTLTQLRIAVAVARARGFAAGARMLGLSQPFVHRTARELERLVGVRLFDVVEHGVDTTAVGADVARLANLVLKEIETAFEDVAELQGKRNGRVVIGSLPLARTSILPRTIAALCADYPQASVEIVEGRYEDLVAQLRHGDIDALVGAMRNIPPDGEIVERPLLEDALSVVARREHPLVARDTVTVDDLRAFPWIVSRRDAPTRRHFENLFGERPPEFGLIECSSLVLARALIISTDRLTLLSRRQFLFEEQQWLFRVLAMDLHFTARNIGLTTRSNWQPTRLQSIFIRTLENCMATDELP